MVKVTSLQSRGPSNEGVWSWPGRAGAARVLGRVRLQCGHRGQGPLLSASGATGCLGDEACRCGQLWQVCLTGQR